MNFNPEFIIILSNNGNPLVTQLISPNHDIPEPALVSGFLTALHSFFSEFTSGRSEFLEVAIEGQHLVLLKAEDFYVGGMVNEVTSELEPNLREIAEQFGMMVDFDENMLQLDEGLHFLFQNIVTKLFSTYQIKLNWIPKLPGETPDIITLQYEFLSQIDGKMNVRQFALVSSIDVNSLRTEFFRLWLQGIIIFDTQLRKEDYVQHNSNSKTQLVFEGPHCGDIGKKDMPCDNISGGGVVCNNILKSVPDIISINELMNTVDNNALEFINCLYNHNLVDVLKTNIKQLYLIREIANKQLQILQDLHPFEDVIRIISASSQSLNDIGISNELRIIRNYFIIDTNLSSYLQLSELVSDKYILAWVEFIDMIFQSANEEHRKNLAIQLVKYCEKLIIDFYKDLGNEADIDDAFDFLCLIEQIAVN